MRSIGTQCPRRPLGDKKKIILRELTSAGIPVGQFCGRSGHVSDILFQYSASAGILCGRPQNVRRTSARISIGRPQNVRRSSAECPSDVRQNVRWLSVRMCRHQPECPMDFCRTSAMSAQKNACENSVRVTSPLV